MKGALMLVFLSIGMALLFPGAVFSANLQVCPSGCDYFSIQRAIDDAQNGDTVEVYRGVYDETIRVSDKELIVHAVDGPRLTWIRGESNELHIPVVEFVPSQQSRSIRGFRVAFGGFVGIQISGAETVNIYECEILDNKGSGIKVETNSTVNVYDTTVSNNAAFQGGGLSISGSRVHLYNTRIAGNSASNAGGGIIAWNATVALYSTAVNQNTNTGIYVGRSSIFIYDSKINGNSGSPAGGLDMRDSSAHILRSMISENSGFLSGAIYSGKKSKLTMINCTVARNVGLKYSGGIYIDHEEGYDSAIISCTVVGNNNKEGQIGGIRHDGRGSLQVINTISIDNLGLDRSRSDFLTSVYSPAGVVYSAIRFGDGYWPHPSNKLGCGWFTFIDDDLHLHPDSECVDAGTSNRTMYPLIPDHDIDEDPRPQGASHDIGSDEVVKTN